MANSSGSSRSVGTQDSRWRRHGDLHGDSSSPIPYREGPLEYTPPVLCKCGAKAARFISWSDLNPGMRYLKCARARDGGCDFYRWVDTPNSSFTKQLLCDLRDAVKYWKRAAGEAEQRLEASRMDHARAFDGARRENERLQLQLEGATRENQRLQRELEGAVRFNEERGAMFLAARRDVAIVQAEMQLGAQSRVELEARMRAMEKERKFLIAALLVCVGLVAGSLMASSWF